MIRRSSKNINIFKNGQTIHFVRSPLPSPKVYRPIKEWTNNTLWQTLSSLPLKCTDQFKNGQTIHFVRPSPPFPLSVQTNSRMDKQYTLSDPLLPSPKVYRPIQEWTNNTLCQTLSSLPLKYTDQYLGVPKQGSPASQYLLCNNKKYPVFEVCYVTNEAFG